MAKTKTAGQRKAPAANVIKSGHDPKNREVEMVKSGKGFQVRKTQTGFESEVVSSKEANELYEQQLLETNNL